MNYVVKSGDSLSAIGARLGVSWTSIAAANNIKPPYVIRPGQRLNIPSTGGTKATKAPVNAGGQGTLLTPTSSVPPILSAIIGGTLLYGIFKVLMKVF
jgi:LysM repeat protein